MGDHLDRLDRQLREWQENILMMQDIIRECEENVSNMRSHTLWMINGYWRDRSLASNACIRLFRHKLKAILDKVNEADDDLCAMHQDISAIKNSTEN